MSGRPQNSYRGGHDASASTRQRPYPPISPGRGRPRPPVQSNTIPQNRPRDRPRPQDEPRTVDRKVIVRTNYFLVKKYGNHARRFASHIHRFPDSPDTRMLRGINTKVCTSLVASLPLLNCLVNYPLACEISSFSVLDQKANLPLAFDPEESSRDKREAIIHTLQNQFPEKFNLKPVFDGTKILLAQTDALEVSLNGCLSLYSRAYLLR